MLQVVLDLVMFACGLAVLLAATAVLMASGRCEVSLRAIAALGIGSGAISTMVRALQPLPLQPVDVLLPMGVALWVLYAAWAHRGRPICSATDWAELADAGCAHGEQEMTLAKDQR